MAKSSAPSTQEHLPIAGIQDSVVIMTDGSVRIVLKVEPINFDLKSDQEQNAIIYAYQSFLNSLDFPIQFVIQSKKLDLERYLLRLQESEKNITSDLLRIQIEDYIGFVRQLISVANIMSKRFYVVISYSAVTKESSVAQFRNILHKQPTGPVMDQDQFARYKAEASNRANIIAGGLGRLSVKCEMLSTQALIELFYGVYNPDVATEERLSSDISQMSSGVISATSPESAEDAQILSDIGITTSGPAGEQPVPTTSPIDEQLSDQGQAVQPTETPPEEAPAAAPTEPTQ
jgi:hypothetical protein